MHRCACLLGLAAPWVLKSCHQAASLYTTRQSAAGCTLSTLGTWQFFSCMHCNRVI